MKSFKALTIAGSDSGGGAGIQADLKTFQELDVFGMSAITAITAQNTLGVHGVYPLTTEAVEEQIEAIGTDMGLDALKTGMLFNADIIEAVAKKIKKFQWDKVVTDPVMIAKGGASLLQEEAVEALKEHLLPVTLILTPNIPEAEVLAGMEIKTFEDRKEAASRLHEMGTKYVLIKGGHGDEDGVTDLLFDGKEYSTFKKSRIATKNTHGTGCTFSAALAAELAKGNAVKEAVEVAELFIHSAIEDDLMIGSGHGPTNHWAYKRKQRKGERNE
jgi:hydroxymethylpyrimidine/phosphomethylpyrimidine kinase